MMMIDIEYHDGVAAVKLNRSVTNALHLDFTRKLMEAFQAVRSDPGVRGLVLGSFSDKFFSIGFDIPQLYELPRDEFDRFYRAYNQACLDLYTLPKPTVAAIGGHAIAGGCILSLCCDYRLIGEGRILMGLNEIKLGVPVPYLADRIVHHLVGVRKAREILETGDFYEAEALLKMGMVDGILPREELWPKSIEKTRVLGSMSPEAYGVIKGNRVDPVVQDVLVKWDKRMERFIELWYADEARERLKAAMKKF